MSTRVARPGAVPAGRTGTPTTHWMQRGACRLVTGVDFFPTEGAGVLIAQKVCAGCEVRGRCLDYALDEGISHGVWGGTSDRERQRLRAARGRGGAIAACSG
jgi:WhiB family transcriptional regulator, redox-sensing transcriptional regulator